MDNWVARENDNINPDITGNEEIRYWHYCKDSEHLNGVFPPEVWIHICTFLETNDLLNFINSSLFFRKLFLKKRIFLLYQPVLEILLPKFQDVRPVVLKCRETCKNWKHTIDKMACTIESLHNFPGTSLVRNILTETITFHESSQIDDFLQHFTRTIPWDVYPSPVKCFNLDIRFTENDFPQFLNRISDLLGKYGCHMLIFKVSIMFRVRNPPELQHKIVEWLNFMPNLQNLEIFGFIPMRQDDDLEQGQVVGLLPAKRFSLRNFSLHSYCPSVVDHQIPEWSWLERYNLSKLLNQHDNLDSLKMTIFNKMDAKIFGQVTSPLKTLVVQYHCREKDVNLSEVFTMLSGKYSGTLENLNMTFRVNNTPAGHLQVMWDTFKGRLNLPKVKVCMIRIKSGFCLDFLLGMKNSLEKLVVEWGGGSTLENYEDCDFSATQMIQIRSVEREQIIKFLGYQHNMLGSNIWNLFPKLKVIYLITQGESRVSLRDMKLYKREDWWNTQ